MRDLVAVLVLWAVFLSATSPVAGQVFIAAPQSTQAPLTAPTDGPKPAFEVASVRPNTGPATGMSMNSPPGRFMVTGVPLQLVLTLAYQIRPDQTEGVPGWVSSSRFDISAKMPDGAPQDQLPLMLQSLLEDRFKLQWHRDTREADVYALVIAREDGRLGPKLAKSDVDCKPIVEQRQAAIKEALGRGRGGQQDQQALLEMLRPKPGEPLMCNTNIAAAPTPGGSMAMTLTSAGMELSTLVSLLGNLSGRPVVDRTGLTGFFDFDFTFSPTQARALTTALPGAAGGLGTAGAPTGLGAPGPTIIDDTPTVFVALEEQLGLELQSERGPAEIFVVDSIEQPEPD
jgi:uncharacterized protein (TIGR03435 family)